MHCVCKGSVLWQQTIDGQLLNRKTLYAYDRLVRCSRAWPVCACRPDVRARQHSLAVGTCDTPTSTRQPWQVMASNIARECKWGYSMERLHVSWFMEPVLWRMCINARYHTESVLALPWKSNPYGPAQWPSSSCVPHTQLPVDGVARMPPCMHGTCDWPIFGWSHMHVTSRHARLKQTRSLRGMGCCSLACPVSIHPWPVPTV